MCDAADADRAVGFVRLVRVLVSVPMTTLGVLAVGAGLAVGNVILAVLAAIITVLLVYALSHDTQLTKALEMLRRGDLRAAEAGMLRVALAPRRPGLQKQRARAYLAAIGWMRGDHAMALKWTRARLAAHEEGPSTSYDRFVTAATEVQLLALLGRVAEARERAVELPAPPPTDACAHVAATTALLVAHAASDPEPVRDRVDEWTPLIDEYDDTGLSSGLLGWAYDALGRREKALWQTRRALEHGDAEHLRMHAPRLWRWLSSYEDRTVRYG